MTTRQTSLLEGDLAAQRAFVLGALINDAVRILRSLPARPTAAGAAVEEHALYVIRSAAAELRSLPQEPATPF